ncbi:streptococcal hemagglutinin isoform X1 [Bactrocera oleae]|uniref:streptococcal hemagglutinin isoform X1 n=1 Tax=Bactrocera oleae TaxID=104688 RepID=UPI00387E58DF
MSTRKSAPVAATAPQTPSSTTKSDNGTPKGAANATPATANTIANLKSEMGSNASTNACDDVEINEVLDSSPNKETPKADIKRASSEPKRITRNSPLFLISPTPSGGTRKESRSNEACDSELTNSESEDGSAVRRLNQIKGRKSLKECRDTKSGTEKDKTKEANTENIESDKTSKDTKGATDDKNIEDGDAEGSAANTNVSANSASSTTTATNRTTRKSFAQELAANTRVTRNRPTSTQRPETPPVATTSTRPRRSTAGKKNSFSTNEPVAKRIRADEETTGVTDSHGGKSIKIEPKDDSEVTEDELPPPSISVSSNNDVDTVKIKTEPIESDESATEASIAGSSSSVTRTRSRWSVRKPQQTGLQCSPSTRATRHSKNASPSPSPTTSTTSSASGSTTNESKRKRGNVQTNALTRSSSLTLLKTAATTGGLNPAATPLHVPDEDSKDSMASSSIDDISITDIKVEKLTPDLVDEIHPDIEIEKRHVDNASSDVVLPLTVETETETKIESKIAKISVKDSETKEVVTIEQSTTSLATTSNTSAVNEEVHTKEASLSPEMISEGVSEISVKQFYKKPKFLENNLGIEEDPKLGEIVQKVSTGKEKEQTVVEDKEEAIHLLKNDGTLVSSKNKIMSDESDAISIESDELKEGDLRIEDITDDKKNAFTDDANSVSTEILSPLVIEEDGEAEVIDDDVEIKDCADCEINENTINSVEKDAKKDLTDVKPSNEIDVEDDLTMEESETISMDNNASVQEDVMEGLHVDEDMENDTQHLENKSDLSVLADKVKEVNEKTKTECDSIQAKLNVENENKTVTKDEFIKDVKLKCLIEDESVDAKFSTDKQIQMEIDGDECIDLGEAMDAVNSDEEDETKLCIDMQEEESPTADMEIIENIEDDEVVAKIDAELKKYEDLEKIRIHEKIENVDLLTTEKDKVLKCVKLSAPAVVIKSGWTLKDEKEIAKITEIHEDMDITPIVETTVIDSADNFEMKDSINANPASQDTPASSTTNSPTKPTTALKEDDSTSVKSGQSTDGSSWVTLELEETLRQKEQHLQNLGLFTHEAAEKRRQEFIQSSAAAEATRAQQQNSSVNGSKRNGKSANAALTHEYTGTLRTVIKINRNTSSGSHTSTSGGSNGRKSNGNGGQHGSISGGSSTSKDVSNGSTVRRQSLKITFQKGRGRGQGNTDRAADQHSNGEDAYYTIQNENEGGLKAGNAGPTADHSNVQTHGRKSYNRSNTTSHSTNTATIDSSHSEGYDNAHHHTIASVSHKKDEKEEILIPEKASSFKFHPGRLCDDQCFYCSGKFGLYDTPCHVGQIKSAERQQKILANEEKLTVDSCLCDACFRHVDRRANVPSYKKRMSVTGHVDSAGSSTGAEGIDNAAIDAEDDPRSHKCLMPDCANPAAHSLRRKCIRKSVKKFLLNFDMPTGSTCVWLCQAHYDTVIQCSGCVLCKRRLGKNHMYHITSDTDRLEKALSEMGIPVQLGIGTAVCKLCRYFANLLMKPPDSTKSQKAEFVKNYRKRLLQFHNIHDGSNDASEADDEDGNITNVTMSDTEKSTLSNSKAPQKADKTDTTITLEESPVKNLASPTDSNGSSIECLGEANHMEISVGENNVTVKQTQQKHTLHANDMLTDYDPPTTLSTDSNSSSAPMSPINSCASGKQQMSKLKAILQSSSGTSNASKSSSTATNAGAASDISNVLRANPNISMRELFPGEEDLGLHFKVPFGSSASQRTPEGWTRVQTFLQYDEATRRLWEELQKPYGNQSSFLRHLILLEKYYRNGDLVLSPNASSNASVYTQTVRQRLTSYDQGHCGGLLSAKPSPPTSKRSSTDIPTVEINEDDDEPKRGGSSESKGPQMDVDNLSRETPNAMRSKRARSDSVDKLTKQLSSNAVTIIARPKPQSQSSGDPSPQKSLLKEKSNDTSAMPSTTLTVVSGSSTSGAVSSGSNSSSSSTSSNSRSILKTNLLGINKAVEILPISASSSAQSTNAANTAGKAHGSTETKQQKILDLANKLLDNRNEAEKTKNSTGTSLLTSPPELVSLQRRSVGAAASSSGSTNTTSTAAAPPTSIATVSSLTASLINNKRTPATAKVGAGAATEGGATSHRAPPPNVVILPDTLTVRERQQRSWRPTLMPVEENLHLIDKGGPLYQTADGRRLPALVQVLSGGKPFLISIFDYNRMCILRREKLLRDQMLKTGKNPHDIKQQQQQQQQSTKVTTTPNLQGANFNKHAAKQQQHHLQQQQHQQQQQAAQQQLIQLQMMQMQKQHALKAPGRYPTIAPKPTATATHNGGNGTPTSHATVTNVSVPNSNASVFSSPMMPLLTNAFSNPNSNPLAVAAAAAAATAKLNSNAWIWSFPESTHMLNGNMGGAQGAPKLPQLLHKGPQIGGSGGIPATMTSKQQQQQQQMLIDNTLMSKIPKTLTVIPQHKLMGNSGNATTNMSHKE